MLSPEELASYLGVPLATVYRWRSRREGPPGMRVGRHVRYRLRDVDGGWTSVSSNGRDCEPASGHPVSRDRTSERNSVASVERRQSPRGVRYDVRYRDPDGHQRRKSFMRKSDADGFASVVEADKLRGRFIDPDAGRVSFKSYAEKWLAAQTFDFSTREAVELRLRLHVYPVLGRSSCDTSSRRQSRRGCTDSRYLPLRTGESSTRTSRPC